MPLYFAYGSNLDLRQMLSRCPGAALIGAGFLPQYQLAFAGYSASWGGAVATVIRQSGACTWGLLYELGRSDLDRLDCFEGHPVAYQRVRRLITTPSGRRQAQVYAQPPERPRAAPARRYLDVIRRAYLANDFDLEPLLTAFQISWRAESPRRGRRT